jgi:hypothetical protein
MLEGVHAVKLAYVRFDLHHAVDVKVTEGIQRWASYLVWDDVYTAMDAVYVGIDGQVGAVLEMSIDDEIERIQ